MISDHLGRCTFFLLVLLFPYTTGLLRSFNILKMGRVLLGLGALSTSEFSLPKHSPTGLSMKAIVPSHCHTFLQHRHTLTQLLLTHTHTQLIPIKYEGLSCLAAPPLQTWDGYPLFWLTWHRLIPSSVCLSPSAVIAYNVLSLSPLLSCLARNTQEQESSLQ